MDPHWGDPHWEAQQKEDPHLGVPHWVVLCWGAPHWAEGQRVKWGVALDAVAPEVLVGAGTLGGAVEAVPRWAHYPDFLLS